MLFGTCAAFWLQKMQFIQFLSTNFNIQSFVHFAIHNNLADLGQFANPKDSSSNWFNIQKVFEIGFEFHGVEFNFYVGFLKHNYM